MGGSYGWVSKLAAGAHIKRGTLYSWFEGNEPDLSGLKEVAAYLKVTRAEIVAAMDGDLPPTLVDPALRQAMVEEFRQAIQAAQAEGILPAPPTRPTGRLVETQ